MYIYIMSIYIWPGAYTGGGSIPLAPPPPGIYGQRLKSGMVMLKSPPFDKQL